MIPGTDDDWDHLGSHYTRRLWVLSARDMLEIAHNQQTANYAGYWRDIIYSCLTLVVLDWLCSLAIRPCSTGKGKGSQQFAVVIDC